MRKYTENELREWQRRFDLVGCTVELATCGRVGPGGLIIRIRTRRIIQSAGGLTVFEIDILIKNDSLQAITLYYCDLELPWPNRQLIWLPDPLAEGAGHWYQLPDGLGDYPRERVINHHFSTINDHASPGKLLKPGGVVQGLLLGTSTDQIPAQFRDRSAACGTLVIIDCLGQEFRKPIDCVVDRSPWLAARPKSEEILKTRRSIFDDKIAAPSMAERQNPIIPLNDLAERPSPGRTSSPGGTVNLPPGREMGSLRSEARSADPVPATGKYD